eukprot:Skav207023  [mRNA]  locus=scaffold2740:241960:242196:- [translate_table: standard]
MHKRLPMAMASAAGLEQSMPVEDAVLTMAMVQYGILGEMPNLWLPSFPQDASQRETERDIVGPGHNEKVAVGRPSGTG